MTEIPLPQPAENTITPDQGLVDRIECALKQTLRQFVTDTGCSQYWNDAFYPGRRLRPLLFFELLQVSSPSDYDEAVVSQVAVSIEFAHRSSIIVDDIVDHDTMRRGQEVFHRKWGTDAAIVFSHMMIASLYRNLSSLPPRFTPLFTTAFSEMCLGQLADMALLGQLKSGAVDLYKNTALKKTSSLFSLIADTLCSITRPREDYARSLRSALTQVGCLYQMSNDYYDDVVASPSERCADTDRPLRVTLHSALAADYGPAPDRRIVIDALGGDKDALQRSELRDILRSKEIDRLAQVELRQLETRCREAVGCLAPDGERVPLTRFCSWLRSPYCWDHTELARAGYVDR